MSNRRKPEKGETFFFVCSTGRVDSVKYDDCYECDTLSCSIGNCFRTKEEAEAAAEKVKALLLSLHEETEEAGLLPKLTAEVFDRPDCPKWAKFAAVDRGGKAFWFASHPARSNKAWLQLTYKRISGDLFDSSDWQNSLIECPVKLPDWCKVGEWVYVSHNGYHKIACIEIRGYSIPSIILDNGRKYLFGSSSWDDVSQARARPYNEKEMKALVGKVVEDRLGNRCLISLYTVPHNEIVVFNVYCSAEKLLELNYTINGKPCGVFEHLNDNGEWVE